MCLPYVLTNTGNTEDRFRATPTYGDADSTFRPKLASGRTGFEVFWDQNSNGVVDAGEALVASWNDFDADGAVDANEIARTDGSREQDDKASLLICYNVPATATAGQVTFVGIDTTSVGSLTTPPTKTDQNNYHRLTIVNDAVLTLTKGASSTEAAPSGTVRFTLSAENAGSATAAGRSYTGITNAGALVWDILPTHNGTPLAVDTVTNPPTGSHSNGGGGQVVYSAQAGPVPSDDPTAYTWKTAYAAGDTVIGYLTDDTTRQVQIGDTVSLRFDVTVPADHPQGILDNHGRVSYKEGGGTVRSADSNTTLVRVTANVAVDVRDTEYTGVAAPVPTINPPNDGGAASNDTSTCTAAAGQTKRFTNRITNNGTAPDTINVLKDASSNLPADWQVFLGALGQNCRNAPRSL